MSDYPTQAIMPTDADEEMAAAANIVIGREGPWKVVWSAMAEVAVRRMTPNPNPSPESVKLVASALCRAAGMDPEGGARTGYSWIDHEADARTLLAALSQTLPAPGEVDHIAGVGNMVEVERIRHAIWAYFWKQDEHAWSLPVETFLANRDADLAEAIAPATVAAANGEGVASDTVAFVQDWLANADYDPTQFDKGFASAIDARVAAGIEAAAKVAESWIDPAFATQHENRIARSIAAAIRLLSQGEGK